ncbi:MAG: LysM peptidoglycan-binding domain-containing protein [Phycisphaera sp.]|nr:LysM peptidoglycan-binding domain-containing protein [Phycisphaera sp.]
MTRENKLAIVVGFGLLLFVGILVSDHLSARHAHVASPAMSQVAIETPTRLPGGLLPDDRQPFGAIPDPSESGRAGAGGLPIDDGAPLEPAFDPRGGLIARGGELSDGAFGSIETSTPAERTHTVAAGEHPGDIAKRYYGKRALGVKLAEYNGVDARRLKIGQVLRVPELAQLDPTAAPAQTAADLTTPVVALNETPVPMPEPKLEAKPEPEQPRIRTVKVAEGDTLFGIARRIYGDGTRWREIARLNNLGDGASLKPGMEIRYASAQ